MPSAVPIAHVTALHVGAFRVHSFNSLNLKSFVFVDNTGQLHPPYLHFEI